MSTEHLEPRLLLSVNTVSTNPQVPLSPGGSVAIMIGTASTVSTSQNISGKAEIAQRTAIVSVTPSSGNLSIYRYEWRIVKTPTDGTVTFARNATNAARENTLTFNRPGVFVVRIDTKNAGSVLSTRTLEFNVVQSFTSIGIRTPDGRTITTSGLTVSGTTQQLTALALDQFGAPLVKQPVFAWQVAKSPTGSVPALAKDGNSVKASFNRAGSYLLKAQSGLLRFELPVNVAQTLTTFSVVTPEDVAVSHDESLTVTTANLRLNFRAFDQFTNSIASLPKIAWATTLTPPDGKSTAKLTGAVLSVTFDRPGTYLTEATIAESTFRFSSSVVPTLSAIRVRTPDNQTVTATSPVTVTEPTQRLTATAVDQFGIALQDQPEISWESMEVPSGGEATLTPDGNDILFEPDHAGKYTLRAGNGAVALSVSLNVTQVLSSLRLLQTDGSPIDPGQPITVESASQAITVGGIDQFGHPLTTPPEIVWTTTSAPEDGAASAILSSFTANISFTGPGGYVVNAQSGAFDCDAAFDVVSALDSIVAIGSDDQVQTTGSAINLTGTNALLTATGIDQFGQLLSEQPSFNWSIVTSPSGGHATLDSSGNDATFSFNKAGAYTVRATSDSVAFNLRLTVVPIATSLNLTPGSLAITFGAKRQIVAQALDQFGLPLTSQPTVTWTATGGTISTKGLFTTGSQAGSFSISGRTGTTTATLSVEVTAPAIPAGLNDSAMAELVNTFYSDQKLDRSEMIRILRSAGTDGTVNAAELADFRFLVSATTPFSIPAYVRELASDVVGTSPANLKFRGQTAGNLSAGSSATLLNNLVDKWFLGADEPQIGVSGLTYQTTVGNLFNGTPSRTDTQQGQLGDCYFIAAVAAIADRNPDAVRDVFIDNGDGTYTVRFYYNVGSGASKADYVTVNRRLPAYSNGTLGFSGYGQSISSTSTTLWIALAEKAYAQWNETGNEGRDGTNRYSAIEGGWMSNVNAPVLGYNSINNAFSSSSKQTLINGLTAKQAVTLGTLSGTSTGGLYGSHAYIVTGYSSSTDKFTLHNPWGVSHPTPLTWAQLQASCSMFVVTNTAGLTVGSSTSPRSLPRINQTTSVADSTQSVPTATTREIQSARLTHRAVDDGSGSELTVVFQPHSDAAPDFHARIQELPGTDSGFNFVNPQPDPGPECPSELLTAELLDLTFLDLDLNAL